MQPTRNLKMIWGAFEIKPGMNQVDEATARLLRIGELAKNKRGAEPIFLCVICGLKYKKISFAENKQLFVYLFV